jgi:starch synthase
VRKELEISSGEEEEHQTQYISQAPRTVDYRPSVQDIAKYLLKLMLDAKLRCSMGQQGRQYVVSRFDYRVVTKRFLTLINQNLGVS